MPFNGIEYQLLTIKQPSNHKFSNGGLLDPIAQWQRQKERELRSSADELAVKALSNHQIK